MTPVTFAEVHSVKLSMVLNVVSFMSVPSCHHSSQLMSEISRKGLCHNLKGVFYHKAAVDRLQKICKRRFLNVERVFFIRHEAYSCCICANWEASRGSHKTTCKCTCSEAWQKRRESQAHLLSNCNVMVKTLMRSFMMQWTGGGEKV